MIKTFQINLICKDNTGHMCLISLQVYNLERPALPVNNVPENTPTGIACPLCNTEIYANATITVKKNMVPAWCTNYHCLWRSFIRVYKEKDPEGSL